MTNHQLKIAWDQIRSKPVVVPVVQVMDHKEWMRLRMFREAQQRAPFTINRGKRQIRNKASGCGQILKRSYIRPGVALERFFR